MTSTSRFQSLIRKGLQLSKVCQQNLLIQNTCLQVERSAHSNSLCSEIRIVKPAIKPDTIETRFFFGTSQLKFLQLDLQWYNESDIRPGFSILTNHIKTNVENQNPEMIFIQNIKAATYTSQVSNLIRQYGYDGFYTDSHDQQGTAMFFRRSF